MCIRLPPCPVQIRWDTGWMALREGAWQEDRSAFEEPCDRARPRRRWPRRGIVLAGRRPIGDRAGERIFRLLRDRGEDEAAARAAAMLALIV
ncbi:MAG TPA: hypothetical protein VEM93_00125, partial [Actinomycetota bacterium]|nr:hypothetical protein [Actinomycetota bacterium]